MATSPTTPLVISPESQEALIKFAETVTTLNHSNTEFRHTLLERDRLYYRESDKSEQQARAKAANRSGDAAKVQNLVVPVVGPQVDSATSYFTEMFLSSYPIFPVVASPQFADVAVQIETLLARSSLHFQWARNLAMCFRDGLKYNIKFAEVDRVTEKAPRVINKASQDIMQGVPTEYQFSGDRILRLDPYNVIFDKRVPPAELHTRGEFAGYVRMITRIELKQRFLDLDSNTTMNATKAFASGTATVDADTGTGLYHVPVVNPSAFYHSNFDAGNWLNWARIDTNNKIQYSDMYEELTLYARIIPKELKIFTRTERVNPGDPQIYKIIIINRRVVIHVQRMTNAHNYLPIVAGQLNDDGLGLQTKSYADNAAPYQEIATALYLSGIHSQRRKVYDRLIYNPSFINKRDIDTIDPVARIPVKQEAYGQPLGNTVYQIPYRDDGVAQIFAVAREVVDMADVATGSNRVQRGQFQKGNKTRFEVDQVMTNSDARPRSSALLMATSWLHPIKQILKYNILQYQPPEELFNPQTSTQVKIDPVAIRAAVWEFKLADGAMPGDKFLDPNIFGQVLQFASINPQAASQYDLLGMFAYNMKMQGGAWVEDFKRTPEQQQTYMQQAQALQGGNNAVS
jgi:hypothetical protein